MILYIENSKDSTPKLLKLINEFSKVAGYKINIQIPVACLYTNSEILEKEYKTTIPFKIAPPKIKYLGINLTKEAKDLYAENYKTFIKEIKEETKWKISNAPALEKLICKMATFPKAMYRFNVIPIKLPMKFYKKLEQTIQTFM